MWLNTPLPERSGEPAIQRALAGERDAAAGVDPVADAELADEPEGVLRRRALAMGHEHARAGLDRPAAGLQGRERQALLLRRHVERVRAGAAQRILGGALRSRRCAVEALLEAGGLPGHPLLRLLRPALGLVGIEPRGPHGVVEVEV